MSPSQPQPKRLHRMLLSQRNLQYYAFFRLWEKINNAVARKNSFSMPWMHGCMNSWEKYTAFTVVEVKCEYWQTETDDEEKNKTLFASNHGINWFPRMPSALENAPGTFQRCMGVIIAQEKWQTTTLTLKNSSFYKPDRLPWTRDTPA